MNHPAPDPSTVPPSATDEVDGFAYLPRLAGKVRLHAEGRLWEDLHENMGSGMDGRCCEYLHVAYDVLKARILEGGSDSEVLAWCLENGRDLSALEKFVWNAFVTKLGWNDVMSANLQRRKKEAGLADRDDILTMPQYMDVDEGRKP